MLNIREKFGTSSLRKLRPEICTQLLPVWTFIRLTAGCSIPLSTPSLWHVMRAAFLERHRILMYSFRYSIKREVHGGMTKIAVDPSTETKCAERIKGFILF